MKIGFDAKRIFHNSTGLGNYARSLVSEMPSLHPEYEYHLFTPDTSGSTYDRFRENPYHVFVPSGGILWRQLGISRDIEKQSIDVFHGLSNELPFKKCTAKYIVTIHDLIFLKYPDFYPVMDRLFYREKFKRACTLADHIIAVSESTKADIIELFNVSPNKISVIYQACSSIYYELDYCEEKSLSYGLFVSSVTERKNLRIVIEAMKLMPEDERIVIKVVGSGGKHKVQMENLIKSYGLSTCFEFLTGVTDDSLVELYRKAKFSIYPSLYEGYGIPIQESLLCGTPVIASNVSSMPEAGMDLAMLVDPLSGEDVKKAILHYSRETRRISKSEISAIKNRVNPKKQAREVLLLYKQLLKD